MNGYFQYQSGISTIPEKKSGISKSMVDYIYLFHNLFGFYIFDCWDFTKFGSSRDQLVHF
jgi:hypothetical protein